MAQEADDLVLAVVKEMRADSKSEFARLNETLQDVRRHVASLDLGMEALDDKFELIREGTVSAIGYAANASRARTRRVEKLEATR